MYTPKAPTITAAHPNTSAVIWNRAASPEDVGSRGGFEGSNRVVP